MLGQSAPRRQLEIIGEHIRSLRIARRFSQVGFAVRAGFTGAYYSSIERGKINFSVINLVKIAQALGVEAGALFPPMSALASAIVEGESSSHEEISDNEDTRIVNQLTQAVQQDRQGDAAVVRLLSAGAAARRLGVSRRTVERWVHGGVLKPIATVEDQGGKLYSTFSRDEIERFADLQAKAQMPHKE
jgi:excisionase family DNA binding protein